MQASHDTHDHAHGDHGDHAHHGRAPGLMGWFTTTNHKDIGTMYLWFSFVMFLVGGAMSLEPKPQTVWM